MGRDCQQHRHGCLTLPEQQDQGEIEFFFDLLSPFAYLAFQKIGALAGRYGRTIRYKAIDLAEAKKAAGNNGPSNRNIPVKYAYLKQDLARWADIYEVPFAFPDPAKIPTGARDSRPAQLGVLFAEQHGVAEDYIAAFWRRSWGEGRFVGDPDVLKWTVAAVGLPEQGFFEFIASDKAAAHYVATTKAACARGIFGVPTMVCDGQMWWGNDRLDMLDTYLSMEVAVSGSVTEGPNGA